MDELSFLEAVALRVMNPDLDPQKLADAVCRRISRQLALSAGDAMSELKEELDMMEAFHRANAVRDLLNPALRPFCTDGCMFNLSPNLNGSLTILGTRGSGEHSRREIPAADVTNGSYKAQFAPLLTEMKNELTAGPRVESNPDVD